MAKLTDAQLMLLLNAAARDDGAAIVPAKMHKAAAAKVAASLVSRRLMREMRAKPGMPILRETGDGRSASLVITRAGRAAIGAKPASKTSNGTGVVALEAVEDLETRPHQSSGPRALAAEPAALGTLDAGMALASAAPRPGTKLALVIDMLAKAEGVTLAGLVSATGWRPHTARAVLTGLRKRGFAIERERVDGADSSTYRILAAASRAA